MKQGRKPSGKARLQDPLGHKKNGVGGACVAAMPGIRAEKPVENSESRHQLSAWCGHKLRTNVWLHNHSQDRDPAKGRSTVRCPSLPQEE